jgi:hypothetical protein
MASHQAIKFAIYLVSVLGIRLQLVHIGFKNNSVSLLKDELYSPIHKY